MQADQDRARRTGGRSEPGVAAAQAAEASAPPLHLLDAPGAWSVVHTHPRAEKVVSERLTARGIRHYLPLSLHRRTYGLRVRTSWTPLFPGYLFCDADPSARRPVFETRRVVRVLDCGDPDQLRRDLLGVARLLSIAPDSRAAEYGPPGSPVEVVCGPFRGLTGEFVRREGRARLVIRIHCVSLATEISIDETWVVPVGQERILQG
jgi:transcription antitermination factor NusG